MTLSRSQPLPRNGDIVFQEPRSNQSRAIQLVTGSRYSHTGIVYLRDGRPLVFEAAGQVTSTPLDEWVARGRDSHFVVKRLDDAATRLNPEALQNMLAVGRSFDGKLYDLHFEWSDDRISCSELVWKIYHRALGIELSEPETIADFELDHPDVRGIVRSRWPAGPPPDQPVVSPTAIFGSQYSVVVFEE
jgi:hypothetical protein